MRKLGLFLATLFLFGCASQAGLTRRGSYVQAVTGKAGNLSRCTELAALTADPVLDRREAEVFFRNETARLKGNVAWVAPGPKDGRYSARAYSCDPSLMDAWWHWWDPADPLANRPDPRNAPNDCTDCGTVTTSPSPKQ